MDRVFFLLFLSITFVSKAQTEFAPMGAQWVFYLPPDGGAFYPETEDVITVSGDTVIDGIQAKKLVTERRTIDHWNEGVEDSSTQQHFVSTQGDSVLSYENNQWEFVFDRAASIGDTLVVYVGELNAFSCSLRDTIVIEAVQDTIILGQTLQHYSYNMFGYDGQRVPGHFFDRIGFTIDNPVTHPLYCDFPGSYWPTRFYCYSDNEITISPTSGCGQILSLVEGGFGNIKLLQTQGQIFVQNAQNSMFSIYDILGKQLFQERITSDNQSFNIGHLPNGILMVVVETEEGRLTKKVVKATN